MAKLTAAEQQAQAAAAPVTNTTTTTTTTAPPAPPSSSSPAAPASAPATASAPAQAPAPAPAPAPVAEQAPAPAAAPAVAAPASSPPSAAKPQQQQQAPRPAGPPPALKTPASAQQQRSTAAKLMTKLIETGKNMELDPPLTGAAAFAAQRANLKRDQVTLQIGALKEQLDRARWQRLQLTRMGRVVSKQLTEVKDRVEDEEARVAANPVDKVKNIAAARAQLLRELAMRKQIFSIASKWASGDGMSATTSDSAAKEGINSEAVVDNNKTSSSNNNSSNVRSAELELAIRYADEWPRFAQQAKQTLATVDSESQQLGGVEGSVPAAEHALIASCDEMMRAHGLTWLREGQRRRTYDAALKSFMADHAKLMQWCRQRLASLSGLQQSEHIQEFCASFRNSTGVMGSNLLVLLESSAALVPNAEVERALLDISDTWLGLETFAYERLRTTLLEQYGKSNIEAGGRAWPEYSKKLINCLGEAQRLLNETNDASSAKLLASLRESCAQLIQDHDAHLLIVEHLADFSVREECLTDHYRVLRAMIFSRLTMLCQSFATGHGFPRRAEYADCVAEASAWVESKAKSDAWQGMLERVEHIRLIIDKSDSGGETA